MFSVYIYKKSKTLDELSCRLGYYLFIYLKKKTGKRGFKTRFRIISIIECFINLIYVFAFFFYYLGIIS